MDKPEKEVTEKAEKEISHISKKLRPYQIEITYQIALIRGYKENQEKGLGDFSTEIEHKKEMIDFYFKSLLNELIGEDKPEVPERFKETTK